MWIVNLLYVREGFSTQFTAPLGELFEIFSFRIRLNVNSHAIDTVDPKGTWIICTITFTQRGNPYVFAFFIADEFITLTHLFYSPLSIIAAVTIQVV
jgi:hypothetical protein